MNDVSRSVAPGAVSNGVALARPLEFSAREKGVEFMLHRRFADLIREQPFAGRVVGIRAHYSPRHHPETGERLESYWRNGNVDERRETVTIRARRGVILASGGHAGNPQVRSMFYPAMREPAFPTSGVALQGPHGQDASALVAGLRVGANLAGMQQNLSYPTTFHISTRLGTPDAYTTMMPGHPTFGFRGSAGVNVGSAGFEEFIAVNQVGKRFFNEVRLPARPPGNRYPGDGGSPGQGLDHKPRDWRNCRKEWVRQMYDYDHGLDAALAMNEGSKPPDYHSGPLWAIFDEEAVERTGWELYYPYVADNGYFFKADTIEELAGKIAAGHEHQRVPLRHLAETVAKLERLRGRREPTPSSSARRTRRCTASTGRRSTRCRSWWCGTTPTAACGSTAASRSWTCRGRSFRASMPEARPWAASTSTASARATSTATSPARMPQSRSGEAEARAARRRAGAEGSGCGPGTWSSGTWSGDVRAGHVRHGRAGRRSGAVDAALPGDGLGRRVQRGPGRTGPGGVYGCVRPVSRPAAERRSGRPGPDMRPTPPLARARLLREWEGRSLAALLAYAGATRLTMAGGQSGPLPHYEDEEYVDVIASYMLSVSRFPAGDGELRGPTDAPRARPCHGRRLIRSRGSPRSRSSRVGSRRRTTRGACASAASRSRESRSGGNG